MRTLTCQARGKEFPMHEMFDVHGRTLCTACCEQFFQEQGGVAGKKAQRHVDPTICVNCGADNGDVPHEQLMRVPTCGACIDFFRNRPYPRWVQASFAALVALVVVSLVWNWRFFQGHFEIKAAMASHDLQQTADQTAAAAKHVPESMELRELAAYFKVCCAFRRTNARKPSSISRFVLTCRRLMACLYCVCRRRRGPPSTERITTVSCGRQKKLRAGSPTIRLPAQQGLPRWLACMPSAATRIAAACRVEAGRGQAVGRRRPEGISL